MRLFDVTRCLSPATPVWPGEPGPEIVVRSTVERDGFRTLGLHLTTHTGTHIETARHFFDTGPFLDEVPLDVLCGPCRVIRIPTIAAISRSALQSRQPQGVARILIATATAETDLAGLPPRFGGLSREAAKYLVECGARLVGIDTLSVDVYEDRAFPAHHTLLPAGVVQCEMLDLTGVPEGDYTLFALPLRVQASEACPARVVLVA